MLRIEDLGLENLKVYQDDELYTFTSDSILLAKFAKVKKGDIVADFCSGSGIVGFYLYGLNSSLVDSVTLVEKQTPLYELSVKSIEENHLQEKFNPVNISIQDIKSTYAGKFSLIVCNPPYMPVGGGFVDEKEHIAICRTEIALPLKDLIRAIAVSLKFGGRTCMVHRADRLIDVVSCMRENNIEPKRLQLVSGGDKEPYLFLIEGVLGGKSGLKILKNIIN
jgi:tRNA1(Val) A37 N6-methylase TrmN6